VGTYDAVFALSEVKLGIIPALISPYVLAAIGERYSRRYMLTAERFSAAEAYRIGLLHEIVPGEEQLDEAIGEIVDSLLANGPNAQAECKALIRVVAGQPIDEQTIAETAQRITRVRSQSGRPGRSGRFPRKAAAELAAGVMPRVASRRTTHRHQNALPCGLPLLNH
jgi:methylglutaconyl-CoA hydratase